MIGGSDQANAERPSFEYGEREHAHDCRCKDNCAVPQKVIYIIFTDKTCIDKLCVSKTCGLTKAEARMLWKLWWRWKQGCRQGDGRFDWRRG